MPWPTELVMMFPSLSCHTRKGSRFLNSVNIATNSLGGLILKKYNPEEVSSFFIPLCLASIWCSNMEVFNIIRTCSCNVITTMTNIFEREESMSCSWIQEHFFNKEPIIIMEDDSVSTRAYNMVTIVYDNSNILSLLLKCLKISCLSKYWIYGYHLPPSREVAVLF